jgi:hypothetical protein
MKRKNIDQSHHLVGKFLESPNLYKTTESSLPITNPDQEANQDL